MTSPPPATVTAGQSFGPTIAAEDQSGNVDPTYNGFVVVSLATGPPGGDTLGGLTRVLMDNGVASFAGLTLNKATSGDTLQVQGGGLSTGTTNPFAVEPGAATQLVVTSQPPATVTAGSALGLTVAVEDQFGNVETTFNGNVAVSGLNGTGAPSTVAAVNGVATFIGPTYDIAGSYGLFLQGSGDGLTFAEMDPFAVKAAPATRLVAISPPPDVVTAGSPFGLVIAAGDRYGNVDSSFSGNVTVALANNPGGSTLAGTTNVTFSNGLAAFSGLTLNKSGTGYTLLTASSGLAPSTSTLDVAPGAATQLVVTSSPPSSIVAGSPFGLVLAAEDSLGDVDPTFTGNVTVALANNPGGSTLGGTTNVTFSNGLAAFSGLTLNKAGTGYTLLAASSGLTPPSSLGSSPIAVTVAAPSQLVVTSPPPATVTAGQPFSLTVAVEDPFGNVATGFSGNLAIATTNGQAEGSLGGPLTVTAVGGVATFAGLSLYGIGTAFTLQVSTTGLPAVTTSPFSVAAGQATQLVMTASPPATVTVGVGFGLTVAAEDPFGNVDPSFAGSVAVATASNPAGGNLGGGTTVAAVGGVAMFPGLTLDTASSGYTLEVTSGALTPVTTGSINVVIPGTIASGGGSSGTTASGGGSPGSTASGGATVGPVHLAISGHPDTVTAGRYFQITIVAEDTRGVIASSFLGMVTLALASNPGHATFGGNLTMPMDHGILTFYGLTLDTAGSGYTIRATASGSNPTIAPPITVIKPAARIDVTVPPPSTIVTRGTFGLTGRIEDAFGVRSPGYNGSVTVALAGMHGRGKLRGPHTVNAVDGVATFDGLMLPRAHKGQTFQIQVTASGLAPTTTSPITVLPPPARAPHPSRGKHTRLRA